MRLKSHHSYLFTPQGGKPRKVTFLAFAGKGWCKIIDMDGHGSPYKRVPRFRLSELPASAGQPKQQEMRLAL